MSDFPNGSATAATTLLPQESPILLRRRNSISTSMVSPNKLSLPATPPQRTNSLELVSLESPFSSYISLRDVLPSPNAATSPAASAINSGYEISIRNHLVKQAAWAYLQPMSASPSCSSAPHFLHRLWHRLSSAAAACFSFLYHHLVSGFAQTFRQILNALWGQVWT
ncbi:uncharacterized protein LOC133299330 [Gastrolobium bilobum]|uniref:uncharacterized protein LOC133299330 n=1 Tax=Gastrolobium bilobum TaxID=150636 RepID=UPI002AAF9C29|nr:uncharacterized protein LOC133299330 [Gastrolobium bilobum]